MVTLAKGAATSSSMPIRSSTVNRLRLLLFTSTATTTSSNSPAARPTMSRWPFVTGSKEPGQTARLMGRDATRRKGRGAAWRSRALSGVPRRVQDRVAVAPLADRGQWRRPGERCGGAGALDDHHRLVGQPAARVGGGEPARDLGVRGGVGRVD